MDKPASDTTPRAVQACHELLAWLIPLLDQFPRSRRFTLGERLESGLLAVLEELVDAAYNRNRTGLAGTGAPNSIARERQGAGPMGLPEALRPPYHPARCVPPSERKTQ